MLFQYFVEAGAIAVRRVKKEDIRHVAKATGATLVHFSSLASQIVSPVVVAISSDWFFVAQKARTNNSIY